MACDDLSGTQLSVDHVTVYQYRDTPRAVGLTVFESVVSIVGDQKGRNVSHGTSIKDVFFYVNLLT
jgi:hypothetical protein